MLGGRARRSLKERIALGTDFYPKALRSYQEASVGKGVVIVQLLKGSQDN